MPGASVRCAAHCCLAPAPLTTAPCPTRRPPPPAAFAADGGTTQGTWDEGSVTCSAASGTSRTFAWERRTAFPTSSWARTSPFTPFASQTNATLVSIHFCGERAARQGGRESERERVKERARPAAPLPARRSRRAANRRLPPRTDVGRSPRLPPPRMRRRLAEHDVAGVYNPQRAQPRNYGHPVPGEGLG